jgi:hypothetical protein
LKPEFDPESVKVIACETVIEEMLPFLPSNMPHEVLDFGLHLVPDDLRKSLQQSIDNTDPSIKTIILGYGLCAMAVVGLKSKKRTLVIPRMDDCIGIFLGSREAYSKQQSTEPGTYYLTKGWIEVNDTPLEEFKRMEKRYGTERANRMMSLMLKNYTRIAYIDTGLKDQEKYRDYSKEVARHFDLKYEEIAGSNGLVKQMLFGPWDEELFVVVSPGKRVEYVDFKTTATSTSNFNAFNSTKPQDKK